ncbi:MAG: hypothetical protein ACRD6U_00515 [Nitrososphaeraceae archaeon]
MGSSAAVMNTLRIIGGAIGPIISGVNADILIEVIIDGKEPFPSASTQYLKLPYHIIISMERLSNATTITVLFLINTISLVSSTF